MINILSAACLLFGVILMFVSALGVFRLSDFYLRVHAPTKAATLGLFFLVLAYAIRMSEEGLPIKALLVSLFISGTIPIGAHVLTKAAYRAKTKMARPLVKDEYAEFEDSKVESPRLQKD